MHFRVAKKEFTEATWPDAEAQRDFVRRAIALPVDDLGKLVPLLLPEASDGIEQRRARLGVFVGLVKQRPDRTLYLPMLRTCLRGDDALRRVLLPLLHLCNDPSSHPEVVRLLKTAEPSTRAFAAALLKQGGGRTALAELDAALSTSGWTTRAEALELAMELAGHHAIPIVGRFVDAQDAEEALVALRLLGDLRYVRAAPRAAADAIEPALLGGRLRIVVEAMRALAAVAPPDLFFERIAPFLQSTDARVRRAAVQCLAGVPGARTMEALQRLYTRSDRATREVILAVLQEIGDDGVLPLLVEALADPALPIRNRALEVTIALARARRVDVTRMVVWLLRSTNVHVRRQAVDIVGQIGDPLGELWPKLLRLLRDEDWWVRERVVDALVELAGPELTRHVAAYLEDDSDVVRRYAVEVLIRLKDPRSLGALVQVAARDTDWWVRERAVECVGVIGDPKAIPHLAVLAERDATLLPVVVQALLAIGSDKGVPLLLKTLEHPDAELRLDALRALARLADARVAAHVRPLAADPDPRVRAEVKSLFVGWKARLGADEEGAVEQRLQGLERLLYWVTKQGGDDLFLISGRPPFMKKLGDMLPLGSTPLAADEVEATVRGILSPVQEEQFDDLQDIDFSFEVKALALRFRANVLRQLTGVSAVFRQVQQEVRSIDSLGLPPQVRQLCDLPDGLVLIGGPTGSGKSTSLAAMIQHINERHGRHIITIEDPIEVVHAHQRSIVTQREVGSHTESFGRALRATLRQDPDVILVGEMRDLDTIAFALSAAETGHLVFATVHTVSADTTVDRLIDAFPPGHQTQIRAMLSQTLRAVVCQHLLKAVDGVGRVPAVEILLNNDAVANVIRKGRCFQLPSIITTSRELGMQSMDSELLRLVHEGRVAPTEAYAKASDKKLFEPMLASAEATLAAAAAKRGA